MEQRHATSVKERGFVTLMASLLIAGILLIVVLTTGGVAFLTRFSIMTAEFKSESSFLAEGCVETALIRVALDDTYTAADEWVAVTPSTSCRLVTVTPDTPTSGYTTIEAQATSSEAYTNLRVVADSATGGVESWEEVATF